MYLMRGQSDMDVLIISIGFCGPLVLGLVFQLLHDYGSGSGLDWNMDRRDGRGPVAFIMPLCMRLRGETHYTTEGSSND